MIAILLAVASLAACPADQITKPVFLTLPTEDQLAAEYPPLAMRESLPGRAQIRCDADAVGVLSGCTVVSENPPAYGFGEAAIRLVKRLMIKPAMACGTPTGGVFRTIFSFKLGEDADLEEDLPEPPAEAVVLARRFLDAWGYTPTIRDGVIQALAEGVTEGTSATSDQHLIAVEVASDAWNEIGEDILNHIARSQAQHLSLSALQAAIAYAKSPDGDALIAFERTYHGPNMRRVDYEPSLAKVRAAFCLRTNRCPAAETAKPGPTQP